MSRVEGWHGYMSDGPSLMSLMAPSVVADEYRDVSGEDEPLH